MTATELAGVPGDPEGTAGALTPPPNRPPTPDGGLTGVQAAAAVAAGHANVLPNTSGRSVGQIVRANVLTRFNAILGAMFVLVLVSRSPGDGLFGFVLIINSLIGIVQEVRAKRKLDALAVLNAPKAHVVRDGAEHDVAVAAVVLDDLLVLRTGDQVPADGIMRRAEGLEVNESLLTGESEAIVKQPDDGVLSGSFVVAGSGTFQATRVGADAYANRLALAAKKFTLTRSELRSGIDTILRYITWAIAVVFPVLLLSQLRSSDSWEEALTATVAGIVGMVPEGLVLLTSIAFLLAAVQLARRKVLVQELPAVEVLARVDVVCLDKTGTLTSGEIVFAAAEPVGSTVDPEIIAAALGALADDPNANATLAALGTAHPPSAGWSRDGAVPFSSSRKWSAASFTGHGSWVIGAPEMVRPDAPAGDAVRARADELAASGRRTLLLARSDSPLAGVDLPVDVVPVALLTFDEEVRPDAADTLRYFTEQGVTLKVISGDNPRTVGAVARRVGLIAAEPFDARELPSDLAALADVLEQHQVFGRVTPQQKRSMVAALQSRGHVVAMTGDGVNDALALKDADIGIAMGSGAPATRAVAQLVLLDDRFSRLPNVVSEGRRVIGNIERVANLFLVKNVYATLLAVLVAVTGVPYPFLPRQLTIISSLTIGIPAFLLALAPNSQRYTPGFLGRVLRFAIPAGCVAALSVFLSYQLTRWAGYGVVDARTSATLTILIIGLWVVVLLARPFVLWKGVMVASMGLFFVLAFQSEKLRSFFRLEVLEPKALFNALAIGVGGAVVLDLTWRAAQRFVGTGRPDADAQA